MVTRKGWLTDCPLMNSDSCGDCKVLQVGVNLMLRLHHAFNPNPLIRHRVAQTGQGISARTVHAEIRQSYRLYFVGMPLRHLSSAAMRDVCALPGRVAQPPGQTSNARNPAGMADRGGVSLVTFFWPDKESYRRRGRTPLILSAWLPAPPWPEIPSESNGEPGYIGRSVTASSAAWKH